MCGRMPHQAQTVDDIFFKWTHGEEKLKTFMNNFNNYRSNLHMSIVKVKLNFLDLKVKF